MECFLRQAMFDWLATILRVFAHGGKHVITVHPMVEIVQPKDCLSISIGLASRSFTNFFSQDLFSEMHHLPPPRGCSLLNKSCQKKSVKLSEAKPVKVGRQNFVTWSSCIWRMVITWFHPGGSSLLGTGGFFWSHGVIFTSLRNMLRISTKVISFEKLFK